MHNRQAAAEPMPVLSISEVPRVRHEARGRAGGAAAGGARRGGRSSQQFCSGEYYVNGSSDKRPRNPCQYCRYQKCLACGMRHEALQKDAAAGCARRGGRSSQLQFCSGEYCVAVQATSARGIHAITVGTINIKDTK